VARVRLLVDDTTQRMTLSAMLEAAGHSVVEADGEVFFADSVDVALAHRNQGPVILLASAAAVPEAVRAMRSGIWGYVFVPLQPDEAALAVERALANEAPSAEPETPEELQPLDQIEMDYIQTVLRKCKHNQARAARVLGIGRNTLWRKLKKARGEGID